MQMLVRLARTLNSLRPRPASHLLEVSARRYPCKPVLLYVGINSLTFHQHRGRRSRPRNLQYLLHVEQ